MSDKNKGLGTQKILQRHKKKAIFFAFFLSFFPGVSVVFLSGSLAQDKADENSDIDFFIITKKEKIFTARFFVNAFLKTTHQLANHEKNSHAGKICPNHFIPENSLEIQEKNIYAASLFSNLIFLSGERRVAQNFFETNQKWMKGFGYEIKREKVFIQKKEPQRKKIEDSEKSHTSNFFSLWLERKTKKFQIARLKKRNQESKIMGDVWLRDEEIRLHPFPKKDRFR